MGLFKQKVMAGPLVMDCVELQFDIGGHKLYHIKPDRQEMQRRQLLGAMRKLLLPSIYLRMRFLNAKANSRQRNS